MQNKSSRINISFCVFKFLLQLCVTVECICVSPPYCLIVAYFSILFYFQRFQTHLNQRREIEPQVHVIYPSPKIVKMIDGGHCAMRGNLLTRNIHVKWAQSVNSTNSFFAIFVVCAQRARITITSKKIFERRGGEFHTYFLTRITHVSACDSSGRVCGWQRAFLRSTNVKVSRNRMEQLIYSHLVSGVEHDTVVCKTPLSVSPHHHSFTTQGDDVLLQFLTNLRVGNYYYCRVSVVSSRLHAQALRRALHLCSN